MMNRVAIEEQLTLTVSTSLIRLAGGGFQSSSSLLSPPNIVTTSSSSSQQWIEQLNRIAKGSISFPNNNDAAIDGKPHDVECRAALSLFHVIRNMICNGANHRRGIHGGGSGKECSNKKKKQQHVCNSAKTKIGQEIGSFEIISELGTYRQVCCATTLANLLSLELEKELSLSIKCYSLSFFDIRSNDSGIIYMVSDKRSNELHKAGKLPCSQCVRWFKGQKGLWWHQLQAHGTCYASATESAADTANCFAVIPFQAIQQQQHPLLVSTILADTNLIETNESASSSSSPTLDPFEMVKSGVFDVFVDKVESGSFSPANTIDSNGATALHWAAGAGSLQFVTYLIETCNCNPSEKQRAKRAFRGRTPLHWAARNGHLEVVEYLVSKCDSVDIDATTQDGTTAFCWASWQGHLPIMRFLRDAGCDVHAKNSFGCNAVLWAAQGDVNIETLSWLHQAGMDFYTVNSNGHSALHKAAQRGSITVCKWIVDTFLLQESDDPKGLIFIEPDAEGHCPSDLCCMDGYKELAEWMKTIECSFLRRCTSTSNHSALPGWFQKEIDTSELASSGRSHVGVRCMVESIVFNAEDRCLQKKARREEVQINLYDID